MSVATNLRRCMYAADMSKTMLCKASGVSQDAVTKYLQGSVIPTAAVIEKLAEALEVPVTMINRPERVKATGRLRPADAAKVLDMDVQTIRVGIQRGMFPFGSAVKVGGKFNYTIDPQKLIEYKDALTSARDLVRGKGND